MNFSRCTRLLTKRKKAQFLLWFLCRERMEKYISDHSEAVFSHGLYPECVREHYPEYDRSAGQ